MRKLFFFLVFLQFCQPAMPQARLGSSSSEIRAEFYESQYNLSSGYDKDGDYYISIVTERAVVMYYFDENFKCKGTLIFPKTQGDLNLYVELYNSQYVIVSDTEWRMYSAEGIAYIKLLFVDDSYFFVWK